MPMSAPRPCLTPGCPALVRERARCPEHERKRDRERGTAHDRGYDARWRKARLAWLMWHPLCAECQRHGRTTAARVVDHIVPHKGDQQLFWDQTNWQSLCDYTSPYDCHGRKSASDGGFGR